MQIDHAILKSNVTTLQRALDSLSTAKYAAVLAMTSPKSKLTRAQRALADRLLVAASGSRQQGEYALAFLRRGEEVPGVSDDRMIEYLRSCDDQASGLYYLVSLATGAAS